MSRLDFAVLIALLVVHFGLAAWAIGGVAEYFIADPPWPRLQNDLFSPALQAVHWAAIALGGFVFLIGYAFRWRRWRLAVAGAYAVMAATCAVETFGFLDHDGRFRDMATEYVVYGAILIYLGVSPAVRRRIGGGASAALAPRT